MHCGCLARVWIGNPLLYLLYKIKKAISEHARWPFTCVGTAGFEPTTP